MAGNKTVFQRLTDVVIGSANGTSNGTSKSITNYSVTSPKATDKVLYSFSSKEERDAKLNQLKQQKLLAYQWVKSGYDTTMEQMAGANQVRIMYRDCDLMDAWPEIGAALDILAEEATTVNKDGKILNIYSKSNRVVSILEDLFINRLDIHILLPMIIRSLCKYGNEYMFLNIDSRNGILGWRELPVHEMVRVENGMNNPYSGGYTMYNANTRLKPDEVKFVWEGHNDAMPYKSWQIAHFRLIKDSIFLPYGCSWLNKARRHWRMLSMMEDAMLLYRLERSVERRIFKVNVGLIDDADVPAFLQEFMNNVKRAPIIDPSTGQIDLRKNFLDVSADYVIPVRSGQDPTSIDSLAAAQNPTTMDDIKYMQRKVLLALRIPEGFLNCTTELAADKGVTMSVNDIRFARIVNTVQQAVIMELTKIALVHLYLLGFTDELTNFTLTLNNPSSQLEGLELDNLTKRITAATSALAEQGGGIPLMSWHQVQKEIMGKTDSEISDMLNDIRLETAIGMELQRTGEIIKKTGLFKQVDRIYGEPGAEYSANPPQQQNGGLGGMGGGGLAGGPMPDMGSSPGFGDDLGDIGEPGAETEGDLGGDEGTAPLSGMGDEGIPMENINQKNGREVLTETAFKKYMDSLNKPNKVEERTPIYDKGFLINEEINSALNDLLNTKVEDFDE